MVMPSKSFQHTHSVWIQTRLLSLSVSILINEGSFICATPTILLLKKVGEKGNVYRVQEILQAKMAASQVEQ